MQISQEGTMDEERSRARNLVNKSVFISSQPKYFSTSNQPKQLGLEGFFRRENTNKSCGPRRERTTFDFVLTRSLKPNRT